MLQNHWESISSTVGKQGLLATKIFKIKAFFYLSYPKKAHDPTVLDFRPIACTNVIYKMITKVLANRMNFYLNKLVNPVQSAFVKGRKITDNFFLAHELIRNYRWRNS